MTLTPRTYRWVALILLLIAAVMRLVLLQDVPPGLGLDEVLNAGIVTSILKGNHAIFFREGFGHEPLYHYLAVPFQFLVGDNFLSIRLPAVLLGLLLVALTMRWARREFGAIVSLVSGLGLAISWWPIVFSRIGIRPILEPLMLVLVAWFWGRRPWLSGILLGLSTYTYTAARVSLLIPVFMFVYYLIFDRRARTRNANLKSSAITLLIALIVFLPLQITLLANPNLQQRVTQLSEPLSALFEGDPRPVLEMTLDTLGVFSFKGDPRTTYSIPDRPLFDPLTSLLFFAGLLIALRRIHKAKYAYILVWLGVTLLPSSLHSDHSV